MYSTDVKNHPFFTETIIINTVELPPSLVSNISNGNRTEWSPIRSVIIRVITKSDDRVAGVQFVYYKYSTCMITDRFGQQKVLLPINHKSYNFREKKNSQVMKERENLH